MLAVMVREGFSEEVTSELRPEGEGSNCLKIWERSIQEHMSWHYYLHLLSAYYVLVHVLSSKLFNTRNNPLLSSHFTDEETVTEKLSTLPKATQLESSTAEI